MFEFFSRANRPLKKGDVQVIRSGNGISHAEEIEKESEIFQIWFDPNLSVSLKQDASYDDYKEKDFNVEDFDGVKKKSILGPKSPMKINTEHISINEYSFKNGTHSLKIKPGSVHSLFIIEGEIEYDHNFYKNGTFIKISDLENFHFETLNKTKIFEIISPIVPSYKTYVNMR